MGKVTAAMYVSVDGVVEDPGGAEGSQHGGWSGPYFNDELQQMQSELLSAADALLLGRVTYEGFAKAWPDMAHEEGGFADRMNTLPKYVATRTLTALAWNATALQGEVTEAVAELKEQSDLNLLIYGSATLVDHLARGGLIDEFRLMVHPIAVGAGQRMFDQVSTPLWLVDTKSTRTGVVLLTYAAAESPEKQTDAATPSRTGQATVERDRPVGQRATTTGVLLAKLSAAGV
jgi:dihydrofolate reductase